MQSGNVCITLPLPNRALVNYLTFVPGSFVKIVGPADSEYLDVKLLVGAEMPEAVAYRTKNGLHRVHISELKKIEDCDSVTKE